MTMRINNGVEIPTDTAAAIISEGLLGGKYLDLRPGGDETNIKPGGEITYTQESILVEELLQKIIEHTSIHGKSGFT